MHKMQKYLVGLGIFLSGLVFATPTTNVLLTDSVGNRVIEVDGTGTLLWEYNTGLNSPQEAIALTNGNILIADKWKDRIIEVDPNKTVVKTLSNILDYGTFTPLDVRRCMNYVAGPYCGSPTLLIVDSAHNKVIECTYPDGQLVWEYTDAMQPREAEKRPGAGTPTYLIVNQYNVKVVEKDNLTHIWSYSTFVKDASWTPCDNVLIVESNRVIEVKPTGEYGGDIVGTITPDFTPNEAIRMPNGNIMVAGHQVSTMLGKVVEFETMTDKVVWSTSTSSGNFVDVDLKGIINVAKILYEKEGGGGTQTTLCGVIVPILQPIIENPFIVATKIVTPTGPVSPDATLTYKIAYTNQGAGTATNVTIIDQIPEGTVFNGGVNSNPLADTKYSYDGGITYRTYSTPVGLSHIRWTIGEVGIYSTNNSGTVGFQVMVK